MQGYFATEDHIRQLMWAVVEAKLSAPEAFGRAATLGSCSLRCRSLAPSAEPSYGAVTRNSPALEAPLCGAQGGAYSRCAVADVETLRVIYNGIGPDCWSDRFRRLTTRLLAMFEPEALIHDWEYTFAPKTYRAFTAANARFAINAVRYALRYKRGARYMLCGALLALLCQLFGWRGFKSASYPEMLEEAALPATE